MKCTHIWIEYEYWFQWHRNELLQRLWNEIGQTILESKDFSGIEIDKEYYINQIEIKTKRIPFSVDSIANTQKAVLTFGNEIGNIYSLNWQNKAPEFVWTHFHMFLEDDKWNPITDSNYPKMWKNFVLLHWYIYLLEFFANVYAAKAKWLANFNMNTFYYELDRVTRSNNLSKYYDYNNSGTLSKILNTYNEKYVFSNIWDDKPKYQWLIWSLSRPSWKPTSLEFRLIPNSFFLSSSPELLEGFISSSIKSFNNVLELTRPQQKIVDLVCSEVLNPLAVDTLEYIKYSISSPDIELLPSILSRVLHVAWLYEWLIKAVTDKKSKYDIDISLIALKHNIVY